MISPEEEARRIRHLLAIAASLANRGYLRCIGFWPDGNPKYEPTERARAFLEVYES